jgi:hypothetical protein
MFPNFRIISDGPLTGTTSFISNEALYSFRLGKPDLPVVSPTETTQSSRFAGQDVLVPESEVTEQATDENLTSEP